jgi:hypothetical protein
VRRADEIGFQGRGGQTTLKQVQFASPMLRLGIRRQLGLERKPSFRTAIKNFHMKTTLKTIIR